MPMLEILAYLATGAISGVLAGLLGLGGGVVIVPALILVFSHWGLNPEWITHLAVGTSLATIIGTGGASALAHHRRGAVHWDLVRQLAPGIILGAWGGSALAGFLPQDGLRGVFGVFLLYVGSGMLGLRREAQTGLTPGPWGLAAAGTGIGALSAIVGIGGGTLTVPFLVRMGVTIRQAVATSSACGLPIALAGAMGFMVTGWSRGGLPPLSTGFVYWPAVLGILVTSMPMAPLGVRLAHSLPMPLLKRIFGGLLVLVAAKLLTG